MADVPEVEGGIQPGDIAVRSGLICGCGPTSTNGKLTEAAGLSAIIHEPYNHSGMCIDSTTIHHVEANGYENVPITKFFGDSIGGAIIRYEGPAAKKVRAKVVDIVKSGRNPKVIGNPFSTAVDSEVAKATDTVSCQEYIHNLYRQAVQEVIDDAIAADDDNLAYELIKEFVHTGDVDTAIEKSAARGKTVHAVLKKYADSADPAETDRASWAEPNRSGRADEIDQHLRREQAGRGQDPV
jgi:hypothetical protein